MRAAALRVGALFFVLALSTTAAYPQYLGCFTDNANRALPQWHGYVNDVHECVNMVHASGFAYAGLQSSGECWGGDLLRYAQVGEGECNMPCRSNGQMCGGTWRNSVYATGIEPPPVHLGYVGYLGCFTDNANRALPQWLGYVDDIDTCVRRARASGFAYSGLQSYGECWGGNRLRYLHVGEGECNTPCRNNGQMCGGTWRNSVYATGIAPPPEDSMLTDSAVGGCSSWWPPVYQPDPGSCYIHCFLNGADACEWNASGDCYVEFGSGGYVLGGYPGWWAAIF